MFKKLVAIEPVSLVESAEQKLHDYAESVVLFDDIPADNREIVQRIGDADAVLLSYTSSIDAEVLQACPGVRYIGMCCSLYVPESANVAIAEANRRGITVTGIRDYGDQGVVEYVASELIRYLHGFGGKQWKAQPLELTDLKVGIIGLGTTGMMIAAGLQAFGADLYYYNRTRKPELEAAEPPADQSNPGDRTRAGGARQGLTYRPLNELLATVDVVCTCLNKNVILLHDEQFARLGNGKILFNTSIGPSHDVAALEHWLANGDNEFFCDSAGALGDPSGELLRHPHVNCMNVSAGRTAQAIDRLSTKVLENIESYLGGQA